VRSHYLQMDNKKYFILSGFISITLFLTLLASFFYIFYIQKPKTFGMTKKTYISISLENIKDVRKTKSSVKKETTQKKVKTKVKKNVPDAVEEDIDIDDLFDNVWTKKINKKNVKKTDIKRLEKIKKSIDLNKVLKKDDSKLKKGKNSTKSKSSLSSGEEINQYLGKIQAIVYNNFNPPPNSQGNSVEALIVLSPLGRLIDFRILRYSKNEALNVECDKIKERLKNVVFPKNPKNEKISYKILLIAELKE